MVAAIVCVDKNWGIGRQGNLLTNIPEDMRRFKEMTTNNVVIMGRKTYDSLPVKPLPNRINVIVTSKVDNLHINEDGTIFVTMEFIKMFLNTLSDDSPIDYYIIGGGQIYNELLPYCTTSYVTKVNHEYENVDTYFPNLDLSKEWGMWDDWTNETKTYYGLEYRFCTYENINI